MPQSLAVGLRQSVKIARMFAVILLLAVIGFLMNALVKLAERRFCFWAYRQRGLIGP